MTDIDTLLTVGQVADLFGVTVRTQHHYDETGLVVPSERSRAGYRLYHAAVPVRLPHGVVYRRLEFPCEQIATLLGPVSYTHLDVYKRQPSPTASQDRAAKPYPPRVAPWHSSWWRLSWCSAWS